MNHDKDRIRFAAWERFKPVQENSEDWQTYRSFKGQASDSLPKRIRYLNLAQLVRHVMAADIAGSFAECGCLAGHSAHLIAQTMQRCGQPRGLMIFDSFEGLSKPVAEDFATGPHHVDAWDMQARLKSGRARFACDLPTVMRNLHDYRFISYFPGWIPETFSQVDGDSFAFVNIDVDLYEPTRDSLEFFYPRLSPGGVIQIDDYNFMDWPGATKAVDEFLSRHRPSFFLNLPLGGAFLIK